MSFPDPVTFFKYVGLTTLGIALVGGLVYWLIFLFKKIAPDFPYWFKYNVLKKKYNEEDVERLIDYDQAGLSVDEVNKYLLLKGFSMKQAKEQLFIYKQVKLKGGKKNE